jgi:PIN domain nuclease of toxin-antitoxin system
VKLLIDTQVLVWLLSGDRRLRSSWKEALADPTTGAFTSAVVAWEYSDLKKRGRLPVQEEISDLQDLYGIEPVDFPAPCWSLAGDLPRIHRDPVDRMLVAHAIAGGFTLVTADRTLRDYPVASLW